MSPETSRVGSHRPSDQGPARWRQGGIQDHRV